MHASFLLPMVQLEERAAYHTTMRLRDHGTSNNVPRRTETLSEQSNSNDLRMHVRDERSHSRWASEGFQLRALAFRRLEKGARSQDSHVRWIQSHENVSGINHYMSSFLCQLRSDRPVPIYGPRQLRIHQLV